MSKEELEDEINLSEEEKEFAEIQKEESTKIRNGQVEFKSVNHSERAEKFRRISDGDTTKYINIALEYFEHRCALSGEKFEKFDKKIDGRNSNLSAEHVVALCLGGDDIVPNLVPTVLQYNIRKNGYYLLDYWDKQKDINEKSLYSSYRLLKLVNYMMKSIQARGLNIKEYRKKIMTPNEIDEYLSEVEKQDEQEKDNTKKKIYSDVLTTTTLDEDNKKVLTQIPRIEGNIPTQREQQEIEKCNDIEMMDIFLTDSVRLLKSDKELEQVKLRDKDGNEISLQDQLDRMLEITIGIIPFEVQVRNAILEKIEELGIDDNKYTVANDLLRNTEILNLVKEKPEDIELITKKYIENGIDKIREQQILNEEQLKTAISNMPSIFYDEREMNKIKLWVQYRKNSFDELISRNNNATDEFVDVLIILKNNGIDLSEIKTDDKFTLGKLLKENQNKEKILKDLEGIIGKIDENWFIGKRLKSRKQRDMCKLIEEIEKIEIELTDNERRKIIEIETKQEQNKKNIQDFIHVLAILKNNGIDLSTIVIKDNFSIIELFEKNGITKKEMNKILNELRKVSYEIDGNWLIGRKLKIMKHDNKEKFIQELENSKIELNEKERKKILEVESKQEESDRKTKEFVRVLVVLKNNGVDLSNITEGKNIEDLIIHNEKAEIIIRELQEISGKITKDWPIFVRLKIQKSNNMPQLIKEIEKTGIELTDNEQRKIMEKEDNQQTSERITKEFVQGIAVLKRNGMNLFYKNKNGKMSNTIKFRDTIETMLDRYIPQLTDQQKEKIKSELESLGINEYIGSALNRQKSRNMKNFKEEVLELQIILQKEGIELTDEELSISLKINKAQKIGKASYDAQTAGCDEKQDFMKNLEKTIEERGKAG